MEPASVVLDDVWLDYAIYGARGRSLKDKIFGMVAGKHADCTGTTRVQALSGINLRIGEGDRVGLVGSNGAGKTSLLRVIAGALSPARGRVRRVGVTSTLFDVYLGMNAEASGWDNISLRGLFLGLSAAEIRARVDEIVAFSGLSADQLSRPARTYSSGMMLRLAFSIATCINPEILLMDEWIWVSDAAFGERAYRRLTDMIRHAKILVIATHADYLIQQVCNRAVYLDGGRIVDVGPVDDILTVYHSRNRAA